MSDIIRMLKMVWQELTRKPDWFDQVEEEAEAQKYE